MEHLIEVAFKGNRREFFRWSFEAPPPVKAAIIVDVERGEDLGRVHATGELAERRRVGTSHGKEQREPLRAALRLASQDEIARAEVLSADDETARRFAVQKARALNLQMKISDAEWQWDRRRLTFYFTAEERVDFRALVRQLETHFGVRVQMWHIGPRDEAKRLDGVGHCGRQLCSAAWLPELLPVKTSLAKEQRLSTITPTQISGACGRLMCCLRYEHDFYVAARKRFPKQGKIVQTLQGEEKVDATDIFRDLVTLRNPAGEVRVIPLAQFRRELAGDATPVEDEPVNTDESAEDGDERVVTTQLHRAASAPPPEPREPREPRGPEARRESRGEPRRDERAPRPEPSRQAPSAAKQPRAEQSRAEPPCPRPPHERDQHPAAVPARRAAPEAAIEPRPTPPAAPANALPDAPADAPADAPRDASAAGDGDQRRSRRRRGRRGGRRHRSDSHHNGRNGSNSNNGNNGNNSNSGSPNGGAPPSNPNS